MKKRTTTITKTIPKNMDTTNNFSETGQTAEPQNTKHTENKNNEPHQALNEKKKNSSWINRYAIIVLLGIVSIAAYPLIKIFIIPIILAAAFTTLFYPLYNNLLKIFGKNGPVSSIATCLVLFLCLVVPSYIVMHLLVIELIHFYQTVEPMLKETVTMGNNSSLLQHLRGIIPEELLRQVDLNFSNLINDSIKSILSFVSKAINKTSAGFFGFFTTVIVMFFTMFYFFIDGKKLVRKIKYLSPIRDDYEDLIISRFLLISRATVMGTVIIGIIQGTIGAVTLLIFGIESWLLWGFVMIILSIIPLVGAWMVLIPAGILQMLHGNIWQGIGILVVCIVVVSNIDNLIRPRLVGKEAKLHDLVIFFSSLGGITAFGVMGFIVGPVIAALFIAMLDIYSAEFDQQLKIVNRH
jgi:predicted PurR-regulated permease PerM